MDSQKNARPFKIIKYIEMSAEFSKILRYDRIRSKVTVYGNSDRFCIRKKRVRLDFFLVHWQ
ncbi:hypothetical protein BJN42_15580 [Pseudomonas koreensis]|nr:hypothetical protein BJN42_15580 [Pseudomonas koreensis]